jgi:hypothetical protein
MYDECIRDDVGPPGCEAFTPSGLPTAFADGWKARDHVLKNAGDRPKKRNAIDKRYKQEFDTGRRMSQT